VGRRPSVPTNSVLAARSACRSSLGAIVARSRKAACPSKTLSDAAATDVNYMPRRTTVSHLRSLDPPSSLSTETPRLQPAEFQTWRVRTKLVGAVVEDDHDYHVVVAVPGSSRETMIIEFRTRDATVPGGRRSGRR
jgi:hypothetical protein